MTALFKSGEPDLQADNKRLQEENQRLHRAVEELSVLNEIALAINSTMETDKINELIVGKCVKRVGVEQGTIHLFGSQEADLAKTLIRVSEPSKAGLPMRMSWQLQGWMLKNKRPLLISDLATDARFSGADTQGLPIKSLLAVPLELKGQLIGILNLFNKKTGEFTADDARLVAIIASQCAQVIENARLYTEEVKLRRLEEDLANAKSIQQRLLPEKPPEIPGLQLAGVSHPARDVGGDYFDFIDLGNNHWGIAVGDVSGKGMPAALMMANLQATLRGFAHTSPAAADTVAAVNKLLVASTDSQTFVTLFYAVYNADTRTLTYCNAGHNPPMRFKNDGALELLETGGLIAGAFSWSDYIQESITLEPGECLLIFTDGVTEAANPADDQFGEERLEKVLREGGKTNASAVIQRVLDAVLKFQADAPVADDITLVCLKT